MISIANHVTDTMVDITANIASPITKPQAVLILTAGEATVVRYRTELGMKPPMAAAKTVMATTLACTMQAIQRTEFTWTDFI